MKKTLLLTLTLSWIFVSVFAQWTSIGDNTYNTLQGQVSIGATNNPNTGKLTVYDAGPLGGAAKDSRLLLSISGATSNNFQHNTWLVRNAAGSDWLTARLHDGLSVDISFLNPQTNTKTWWERDPSMDLQSWGTNDKAYLTLRSEKLGIGTTNPFNALHVKSGAGQNLVVEPGISRGAPNGVGIVSLNDDNTLYMSLSLQGDRVLLQPAGGNVGIGTINPTERLAVNGTIRAKAVKVEAAWSDYVFYPNYRLRSLREVSAYIKVNGHLPEVPSTKEVEANGVNLGETSSLLLKKIEELTLYLIEKDRQIAEQNERLKKLESLVKKVASKK